MVNAMPNLVDIGRTVLTLFAMLAAMYVSAHLVATAAVAVGLGSLTTGLAGQILFAVSAFIGLVVVFLGYSYYYYGQT